MHSEKIHNPQRIGPILLGLLFSLVSWTLLFGWMAIFTDAWLVPWDTFTEASKPPEDNWQRLVNDFFQLTYGFYLPGVICVATSVILLFYGPRRRTGLWIRSGALFLLSTMLFIALSFIAGVLYAFVTPLLLTPPLSPLNLGYQRNWPVIAANVILLLVLFMFQSRVSVSHSHAPNWS
jgi:hypothetical protein